MAGVGMGEPQLGTVPASLLLSLLRNTLLAESPGTTRKSVGASEAQVIPEVPAPVPWAAMPTRLAYAVAWVLRSNRPTLTPPAPGR